jgi:hypothetical protein
LRSSVQIDIEHQGRKEREEEEPTLRPEDHGLDGEQFGLTYGDLLRIQMHCHIHCSSSTNLVIFFELLDPFGALLDCVIQLQGLIK